MRTNEEIINILNNARLEKNLSISELARRVEMAKSAISRYFNLTREFPLNRVNDFAKVLDLDPEYILGFEENENTDILEIYNQLSEERQTKVYEFAADQLKEQNSNVVDLRKYRDIYIQSKVSAGRGIVDLDQEHKDLISYGGYVPAKYDLAFQVEGDSMQPLFENGEVIFVECDSEVRNGQIGVVLIDDEAFVKKMYVEEEQLRLVSLNKKYDDITVSKDIKIVGRAII